MQISPVKPPISMAVFQQLDIRVGRIQSVADVPGSDKLMQADGTCNYFVR